MDTYLERREGRRVRELFAEAGEEAFRAIETDVLRELAGKDPLLVSCGGGAVLAPENRAILAERGYVVYLQVTADEAASRISDVSTRPLFRDLETARATIEARLPLYEDVADAVVNTAGKSPVGGNLSAQRRQFRIGASPSTGAQKPPFCGRCSAKWAWRMP